MRGVVTLFDATAAFSKQFVPHEDGYLFYAGRTAGGKFVSEPEYQELVAQWQSVAGRKGTWKTVAAVFLIIALGMIAKDLFDVGEWTEDVSIWGAVALVVARIMWASFAPRRLVKGRPDVVPPRPLAESKKLARSMLPWRMIISVFIVSTGIFVACLSEMPQTFVNWLWLVGSGAMSAAYGWIAIQKFRDRDQN
ncbi:MAG: hypothetical protein B7Y36_02910 [Novosphingobium sp. 28-62-57]|nr:MAG: hypothetical protein B7Z34_07700 [Novosphingobium sp. 12-62-10]OYZ12477.1 MAG: hypothetical protein B7Y36_02910 [Novosphingobium sp. 28-62-57]